MSEVPSPPRPEWRRGLLARLEILIVWASVAPMLLFGGLIWYSLGELTDRVLSERRGLAGSVAHHVDQELRDAVDAVGSVPSPFVREGAVDGASTSAVLRAAYLRSRLLKGILLADGRGRVLWVEPSREVSHGFDPAAIPEVGRALTEGRPGVSSPLRCPDGVERIFVVVPLRDAHGRIGGLVAGAWDVGSPDWIRRIETGFLPSGATLDLVDASGTTVMSTVAARRYGPNDHEATLEAEASGRSPRVRIVRNCGDEPDVVAIADIPSVRWTLLIRQTESDLFAPMFACRRRLVAVGIGALLFAGVYAWGISRSIKLPLRSLTDAAERITRGDVRRPVEVLEPDEIGRLGRSFETMRRNLAETWDRLREANAEMEKRVEDRTRELQTLYRELNQRDHLRGQLLGKVIRAQEEERKRLARELHDETCQMVTALKVGVETALAAPSIPDAARRLDDVKGMANRTLDELHRIIYDLRPSVLDDLGLLAAIRWYAERHLVPQGIAVHYEFEDLESRLSPETEIALFRAVQESLSNVARHARAETVLIEVALDGDVLRIGIEDDGRGFAPEEVEPSESGRGLGILGIRERMELIGGEAKVDSSPGSGTRVTLRVPLPSSGEEAAVV